MGRGGQWDPANQARVRSEHTGFTSRTQHTRPSCTHAVLHEKLESPLHTGSRMG